MRRPRALVSCAVPLLALLCACSTAPAPEAPGDAAAPTSSSPTSSSSPALDAAARALLAGWATAHGGDAPDSVIATGPLTSQDGDWTSDADPDGHKLAYVDGLVDLSPQLTVTGVPGDTVQWADGSTAAARTLPPAAALPQALVRRPSPDVSVAPLVVLAATATSTQVSTTRGPATVPAWELTLQDSAVRIVVVAATVVVAAPAAPPLRDVPDVGQDTTWATAVDVGEDGRTLTVHVIGAQEAASEPCGEDYSVSTVADDAAVAIVVVRHPYRGPDSGTFACTLVGADREAVTVLDTDLAGRPVLDVATGLPVAVV
ncbi:hypothetical protein GB931_07910 [Modestobacter sp. I12A-02628]|uniref:Lipoprotein n=1 Tax=Goekera deserti TaxID=2497753 RepID=A0A7K3WFD7_9ACTN|nr:hypothetical protein [Goekera deserti]MPQ97849.1 hypothetical protein [Goekera deserti]NDI48494.1 hypothetical protein [Goekera deserti]NEL55127.1 hypothetical protein [Goekera deserti]